MLISLIKWALKPSVQSVAFAGVARTSMARAISAETGITEAY